jgi:Holliday junction DNA helicase RuvA
MIGSLRGAVVDRDPAGELLVDVGGVGYRVLVTPATLTDLGQPGTEVFLWVHHHIREDAQVLYGFAQRDERVVFSTLLQAHGVGPSLALNILAVHNPGGLRRIVAEEDVGGLCLVPGVGKKTATRLLIELKGALDMPDLDLTASGAGRSGGDGDTDPRASATTEVREALLGLGYGSDEVIAVLREVPGEPDAAQMLKDALQRLATW